MMDSDDIQLSSKKPTRMNEYINYRNTLTKTFTLFEPNPIIRPKCYSKRDPVSQYLSKRDKTSQRNIIHHLNQTSKRKFKTLNTQISERKKSSNRMFSFNKVKKEDITSKTNVAHQERFKNHRLSLRRVKKVSQKKSLTERNLYDLPYLLIRKLGKGSYAYVYLGLSLYNYIFYMFQNY